MARNVFVSFFLVTNMNEPMIDTHFELSRRLVTSSLIFIKLLQALEGCIVKSGSSRISRQKSTE